MSSMSTSTATTVSTSTTGGGFKMNKGLIIHVISEVVVFSVAVLLITRSINKVKTEVQQLRERVDKQEEMIGRLIQQVEMLTMRSAPVMPRPSPMMYQNMRTAAPMNHQGQSGNKPPSAPSTPQVPSMMDSLFNIIPAMMPMMSGGKTGMIITELEKPFKPEPSSVEVVDDEDDPDINEALEAAPTEAATTPTSLDALSSQDDDAKVCDLNDPTKCE